jgi:hypothetical protein
MAGDNHLISSTKVALYCLPLIVTSLIPVYSDPFVISVVAEALKLKANAKVNKYFILFPVVKLR